MKMPFLINRQLASKIKNAGKAPYYDVLSKMCVELLRWLCAQFTKNVVPFCRFALVDNPMENKNAQS